MVYKGKTLSIHLNNPYSETEEEVYDTIEATMPLPRVFERDGKIYVKADLVIDKYNVGDKLVYSHQTNVSDLHGVLYYVYDIMEERSGTPSIDISGEGKRKRERAKRKRGGMIMTGIGLTPAQQKKYDEGLKAYTARNAVIASGNLGIDPVLSIGNKIYVRVDLVGDLPESIHFGNRYLIYQGQESQNGTKYYVYTIDFPLAMSLSGSSLKGILSGIVKFFAPNLHKNISTFGQRDRSRY